MTNFYYSTCFSNNSNNVHNCSLLFIQGDKLNRRKLETDIVIVDL